jgi:hypothetical protein
MREQLGLVHEETNENGQRLIDLCEAANLRPAFSHFANRKSRLQTYADPKGNPYQLDHIIISQKWWKSIKSCRSYNTIAIGSDHKNVCAKFKASFRAAKQKPIERCKFNNEKLLEPEISKEFNIELTNRFTALHEETTPQSKAEEIQIRTDSLNKALIETSKPFWASGRNENNHHGSDVRQSPWWRNKRKPRSTTSKLPRH